ncbi:MAG: hypothetical protein HGA37_01450 [Lentimicrobium sp.]|nr:hypothetical protein [Lentimicrobium sp.]
MLNRAYGNPGNARKVKVISTLIGFSRKPGYVPAFPFFVFYPEPEIFSSEIFTFAR